MSNVILIFFILIGMLLVFAFLPFLRAIFPRHDDDIKFVSKIKGYFNNFLEIFFNFFSSWQKLIVVSLLLISIILFNIWVDYYIKAQNQGDILKFYLQKYYDFEPVVDILLCIAGLIIFTIIAFKFSFYLAQQASNYFKTESAYKKHMSVKDMLNPEEKNIKNVLFLIIFITIMVSVIFIILNIGESNSEQNKNNDTSIPVTSAIDKNDDVKYSTNESNENIRIETKNILIRLKNFFDFKQNTTNQLSAAIVGILASVIASIFLRIIYAKSQTDCLDALKSITDPEYLEALIEDIVKFNGLYRENEIIEIILEEYKNDQESELRENYYKLSISYEYSIVLTQSKFTFSFYRIKKSEDLSRFDTSDKLIGEEFHWIANEIDCSLDKIVNGNNFKSVYNVSYCRVNGVDLKFNKPDMNKDLLEFIVNIPKESRNSEKKRVKFKIEFPVRKNTNLITITHQVPTKNSQIKMNENNLPSDIELTLIPIYGSSPPTSQLQCGIKEYYSAGWIMPKNSYVISWDKKK